MSEVRSWRLAGLSKKIRFGSASPSGSPKCDTRFEQGLARVIATQNSFREFPSIPKMQQKVRAKSSKGQRHSVCQPLEPMLIAASHCMSCARPLLRLAGQLLVLASQLCMLLRPCACCLCLYSRMFSVTTLLNVLLNTVINNPETGAWVCACVVKTS